MEETRKARAVYALYDAGGGIAASGEADAEAGDEALNVGSVALNWLDADTLRAAGYSVTLDRWPAGRLVLSQLGRRFEAFAAAAREARDRARVAGLLAHGLDDPLPFTGAVLEPAPVREARLLLYATHLTVVPKEDEPFQVPYGAIAGLRMDAARHAVFLETTGGSIVLGQLGRRIDAFHSALGAGRGAQAKRLADLTGETAFADGLGVSRSALDRVDELARAFAAPERAAGLPALLGPADPPQAVRFGFVELLDLDERLAPAARGLPEHLASFLLVPVRGHVVLEILAGPSAATYVFSGDIEEINRDLQALHFRRRPLALSGTEAELTPSNPYRLALRKLPALQRLRAAARARLNHGPGWEAALAKAISGAAAA